VIKCQEGTSYGTKADIWSIGCTIAEMLTGKPPWPEFNSMWAAVFHIANSTGPPSQLPKDISPELSDFLAQTFERDPARRPSAEQLLKHPYLASIVR
jgi:serine/threonine protein kinase